MNTKRMMGVAAALGALVAALLICSCDKLGSNWQTVGQSFTLEGVKRISPDVAAGDDPATFGQNQYGVGPEARMLLRFEDFMKHVPYVDVDVDPAKKKRVWVYLTAVSDAESARARLKLCPLTSGWMMLATWRMAHPFGAAGQWKQAGGDYDSVACASPVAATAQNPNRIEFDMTEWFIDSIRGRGVNHGWVLTATEPVTIVGEPSARHSPRVEFDKFLGSYPY